ncbi:MAG: YaeQ family protein [Myxococcota bacterium]
MLELASRLVLETTLVRATSGAAGGAPGDATATPLEARRLFLAKRVGESMGHVAMKLLAWAVHWRPGEELLIEAPAGQHYKPDVVRFGPDGRPRLWIDCGRTAPKKLVEVVQRNRAATVVIVKRGEVELGHYRDTALPRLERLGLAERVAWLAFDEGFVERVAARLWARHEVIIAVASGRVAVSVDGGARDESALVWLPKGGEPHNVLGSSVADETGETLPGEHPRRESREPWPTQRKRSPTSRPR